MAFEDQGKKLRTRAGRRVDRGSSGGCCEEDASLDVTI